MAENMDPHHHLPRNCGLLFHHHHCTLLIWCSPDWRERESAQLIYTHKAVSTLESRVFVIFLGCLDEINLKKKGIEARKMEGYNLQP